MAFRKLLILPFFGEFPPWMDLFLADFEKTMKPMGYDLLIDTDIQSFKQRVKLKLLIECPITWGSSKSWDYRASLGVLYTEEIKDYDYYGHCDLDVVWGDMDHFLPDSELSKCDVYSSHHEYVCGCFSLYRNINTVNHLFMRHPMWRSFMDLPEANGWVETDYSRLLEKSGLNYAYEFNQGNPWDREPKLKKDINRLYQLIDNNWKEIMFFHFRHSKRWPL